MSRIKGKNTSIEIKLRKDLWHKGYRYRVNYKKLPGSPDIVLTKYKIAIFCDSEFFHGKEWQVLKPRLEKGNNPEYWVKKIERNRQRDDENDKKLLFLGWTVIHFWGKEILKNTEECVRVIEETIFDMKIENDMYLECSIDSHTLPITIERRAVKNLNLYIKPPNGDILITAPPHMSESQIRAFVQKKMSWIERKREEVRAVQAIRTGHPNNTRTVETYAGTNSFLLR